MKEIKIPFTFDLLLTFISAFLLRTIYIFELKNADPTFYYPLMDPRWHWQWAMGIVQGDFWGKEVFFRAPLYPYFLALLIWVFGANFLAIRVIQALLGSITSIAVHLLGFKLAGRRNGLLSGLICAFYGTLIYFDGEFLTEVLYLPLLFSSLYLLLVAQDKKGYLLWFVAGFLFGFAAITRPNNLFCLPFLFLWMLWKKWEARQIKSAILWLIAFALPVLAVTVRNGLVGGEYVLIASQGGINFYIGNNPEADGKTAMNPVRFVQKGAPSLYQDSVALSARMVAQKKVGKKLSEGEVSAYWYNQAFSYIKHYPYEWAKLTLKKVYFLVNGYEIPSNREIYRVRKWAPVLKFTMVNESVAFPYGLLFPLAGVGLIIAWFSNEENKNSSPDTNRLLTFYLISYSATVIGFFVTARHRVPIVPALMPYASLSLLRGTSTVAGMHNFFRKKYSLSEARISARTLAYTFLFVIIFLVSNSRFFGVREDKTREFHIGLGEVYGRQGKWTEAEREYKEAITLDPQIDRGWYGLAVTYFNMKKYDEALLALEKTLKLNPYFAPAYSVLGNIYHRKKDYESAESFYRKALEIEPCLAVARHNLANLLRLKKDFVGYESELAMAVKCDPYFVPALLDMAHILIHRGKTTEGEELIRRVLVVEPNNERAKEYLSIIYERKK